MLVWPSLPNLVKSIFQQKLSVKTALIPHNIWVEKSSYVSEEVLFRKNIFSFRWQQWWIEIALTKWQTNNTMPLSYSTGENIGDSLWYKTWVERGGRGWYSDKDGRPVAISPSLIYKAQVFTCLQHCFIFGKFTIHIYPVHYLILSASKYFRNIFNQSSYLICVQFFQIYFQGQNK